ncbi:MAG TPA: aryl-sulfate sulfotransferase [Firmicutes bacterium]|nr:aryl-sulfate sulfotransferase [Bacillota bacterium]
MSKFIKYKRISIPVIIFLVMAVLTAGALAGLPNWVPGPPPWAGEEGPPPHAGTVTCLTPEKAAQLSSDEWVAEQAAVEAAILADFAAGTFTLDNPLVVVNPYGNAPLSALVLFETEEAVSVDLVVKGKDASVDIKHSFSEVATTHIIPVYGLYEGANTVVFATSAGDSSEIDITTGELPQNVKSLNATVNVEGDERMYPGITFACVNNWATNGVVVGFDAKGDVRSLLPNIRWTTVPLANGRILAASPKFERGGYFFAGIVEVDLMGKVHTEVLRNGVHHGYRKTLNGNWIVIADMVGRDTVEDHIVELDGETGQVVRSWDMRELWDLHEYVSSPTYDYNSQDWLHVNSIWLCPGEDAILVSGRHQDSFFKVDLAKSEIVWVMTEDYEQYTDAFKEKLLTPIGDDFEYVWGQHNISMMPNGRILVFDNGDGRSKDSDKMKPFTDPDNYSRVVIYEVDEKNMTVKQVWQYGKERYQELFSAHICGMDAFGNNHFLMNFGGAAEGNIPGILAMMNPGLQRAFFIEWRDDEVIWELEISGANVYQTDRMDLYDINQGYYELGVNPGKQLGTLFTWKEGKTN